MKKAIFSWLILSIFAITFLSCNSNKNQQPTLKELKKKYETAEFRKCDEWLQALNETSDFYFSAIDKLIIEDKDIDDEFMEIQNFFLYIYEQPEDLVDDCLDQLVDFEIEFDRKMEEKMGALIDFQEYDYLEYDDDQYIESEEGNTEEDIIL